MEKYQLSKERLPLELYRIQYPGSRTTYFEEEGFTAAHRTKVYREQDVDDFKSDVVKQFTWHCRDPLPFISLFSDLDHAENWGLKRPWQGDAADSNDNEWTLFVIDTKLLDSSCFFNLEDLVNGLRLEIPDKAEQHISGAYLCLHTIPAFAIVDKMDPGQVGEDSFERYLDRKYSQKKWGYLDGSGSEREALQENWNTIFEKNMEDNW
ncbi:hypothetical protein CNMCM5793_002568 [Aspergillus hiratsukae]|uniref:DUF7587 domain-containing protein n=1 Tax=Aspergillus hiratsukae TaxID=1194566 RepID=A0A8H6UHM3_9EURO|nr:hypothetical protein CNMCM5793_002568 [Aspergillus hiratsukae]